MKSIYIKKEINKKTKGKPIKSMVGKQKEEQNEYARVGSAKVDYSKVK